MGVTIYGRDEGSDHSSKIEISFMGRYSEHNNKNEYVKDWGV